MGFLNFIKNLGKSDQPQAKGPIVLSGSREIQAHLESVCEQKTALNLQMDERPGQYSSIFVEDFTGKHTALYIDTLLPKEGNQYIEKSELLEIYYTFLKKRYRFETKFLCSTERKLRVITLSIPRFIDETARKNSGSASHVESPLHVRLKHLESLCDQSVPLDLRVNGKSKVYKSVFLKIIKGGSPEVYIDILNPKEGNSEVEKSYKVDLSYNFQGRYFEFESDSPGVVEKKLIVNKLLIPRLIEEVVRKRIQMDPPPTATAVAPAKEVERRQFQRVTPSPDCPLSVYLEYGKTKRKVDNISMGGASFYTKLPPEKLKVGTAFQGMTIIIPPGNEKIVVPRVIIRSFVENADPKSLEKNKCSVEFFGLNESGRKAIERYITKRKQEAKPKPGTLEEALDRIDEF